MADQTYRRLSDDKHVFAELINTLHLLVLQARAYKRALPIDNYQARAAVSAHVDLAQQALSDARDLLAALELFPTCSLQEVPAKTPSNRLSPRELQVLTLAADGLTNKEIAFRLSVSERTIQFHMNSIFNKADVASRTEAVVLAMKRGWIIQVDNE
jgi:DNA-binding NarL/FixJ family response regulator